MMSPNGGTPMHMVMRPRFTEDAILHCDKGDIEVFTKKEWARPMSERKPFLRISSTEAVVLAAFVGRWNEVSGHIVYKREGVNVEFDY